MLIGVSWKYKLLVCVCVCVTVQVVYVVLLRAYRAAALRVNMLKEVWKLILKKWLLRLAVWNIFDRYKIIRPTLAKMCI